MPARYLAAQGHMPGSRRPRARRARCGGQVWIGGDSVTCIAGTVRAVTIDLPASTTWWWRRTPWIKACNGARQRWASRPGAGGEHPLMGTHNRLLRIATAQYPRAYLEIIAINPAAPPPGRRRWFDLDDPTLRQPCAQQPRLVHFVASTDDAAAALQGAGAGSASSAARWSRPNARRPPGMLRWQISVRRDGQRLFYGGLPTLIQWGTLHPADSLPDSGLALQSLGVQPSAAARSAAAHSAIGLQGVRRAGRRAEPASRRLPTPEGLGGRESAGPDPLGGLAAALDVARSTSRSATASRSPHGTLYLVRHGQASFGADDYDQLSDLGHKQSVRLGEYFAQERHPLRRPDRRHAAPPQADARRHPAKA